MSERVNLTRRGLFRGVSTAALLSGCADRSKKDGTAPPVDDATAPGEIGPDPAPLRFSLNGKPVEVSVEPRTTLLDALRIDLKTTGPKQVCDRGACGACTVLVDGVPKNACMMLAHDVAGQEITTVEGLSNGGGLSALQKAFIQHDALQCGFCTSGMLMTCTGLLRRTKNKGALDADEVRRALGGNICRCGTYPNVIAAVLQVARKTGA